MFLGGGRTIFTSIPNHATEEEALSHWKERLQAERATTSQGLLSTLQGNGRKTDTCMNQHIISEDFKEIGMWRFLVLPGG